MLPIGMLRKTYNILIRYQGITYNVFITQIYGYSYIRAHSRQFNMKRQILSASRF